MNARCLLMTAVAVIALGGPALAAADSAKPAKRPDACFFSSNWSGWRSPDDKTIYLRVGVKDIYKVDLSFGSTMLTYPDAHLVSRIHGPDMICAPIDLDLTVSDGAMRDPLFVKAITKLTPEQIAAIPKKFLP